MATLDEMFTALVADEKESEHGKSSFPDYPDEKPTRPQLVKWLDKWEDSLVTAGYSILLSCVVKSHST